MRSALTFFKWLGGSLLGLLLLVLLAVFIFNLIPCRQYSPFLVRQIEKLTAAEVQSFGACRVHIGWQPELALTHFALRQTKAQSPWESLSLEESSLRFRLWPLLTKGLLIVEAYRLEGARLALQVTEPTEEIKSKSLEDSLRSLSRLYVREATLIDVGLSYRGSASQGKEAEKPSFTAHIERLDAQAADADAPILVRGQGDVLGLPLTLNGEAGSLRLFQASDRTYPLLIRAHVADQDLILSAQLDPDRPTQMLQLTAKGASLKALSAFLGRDLGRVPAYRLQVMLEHSPQLFRFPQMSLILGRSEVNASGRIDLGGERPALQAEVEVPLLRHEDLTSWQASPAATPRAKPGEKSQGPLFSHETFAFKALRAMDAAIHLKIAAYTGAAMGQILDRAEVRVSLKAGDLQIKPLKLGIAGGAIEGSLQLDASRPEARFTSVLKLRRIDLKTLFGPFARDIPVIKLKPSELAQGLIAGQIKLKAQGKSPHALAQSLDGSLRLALEEGRLSATVIEAFGFDLTETITSWFANNPTTPLQCMIASFDASQGRFDTKAFLIATADSNIVGRGFVDLGRETLHLTLEARPKDFSVGSARSPITIEGPLRSPRVALGAKGLAARSIAAAALGALVNPLLAIVPFIEPGLEKGGACLKYVDQITAITQKSKAKL